MNSSKELAYIIRNIEKEKIKYAIVTLNELKRKVKNKETILILNLQLDELNRKLDLAVLNSEND